MSRIKKTQKVIDVEVTALDIKRGIRKHSHLCPVARAVRRAIRGLRVAQLAVVDGPSVGLYTKLGINKDYFEVALPKKAQTFIDAFDDGKEVKPFSFKLRYSVPA